MWISGTWRLRSCIGHDNPEVEGTGDIVNYCKVVTTVLEKGEMKITFCSPKLGDHGLSIVYLLDNTEDYMGSGRDDTNHLAIGTPTDTGIVSEGTTFNFDGHQLTIIMGSTEAEDAIFDLEELEV